MVMLNLIFKVKEICEKFKMEIYVSTGNRAIIPWLSSGTHSNGTVGKNIFLFLNSPREDAGGFKSRIRPSYPQRVVKCD